MPDILHLLQIQTTSEAAYAAIASAEGVRNWLSRDADFDSRVGVIGEVRFAAGERILKIRIEELTAGTCVVWKVLSAAMPTWAGTTIEFRISKGDTGTMLHFTQRGFEQSDDLFAMCTTIWAGFLISLKQYLETGHGMPHPDDILSRSSEPT